MIPLSFIGYNLKYLLDSISMLWVILISGQNAKNICCRAHQDAFKPFSLAQRSREREGFSFLSSQDLMIQISGLGLTINCFFLSQLMSDTAENSSRWKWIEFIICEFRWVRSSEEKQNILPRYDQGQMCIGEISLGGCLQLCNYYSRNCTYFERFSLPLHLLRK